MSLGAFTAHAGGTASSAQGAGQRSTLVYFFLHSAQLYNYGF